MAAGASLNLLLGLGASSLFVDEAFSWAISRSRPADLYAAVERSEVAPPAFYALLRVWRELTGSDTEASMRLLSVLAALPMVAATAWLASLFGGRRAALWAGALAAASPLVVEYGTQVRAYVFCMLAVTVAVAAAVRALQEGGRRWLVISAAAAVAALWLHYTALLVIAPLVLWLVVDPRVPGRSAAGYAAALAAAQAVFTPLMLSQRGNAGATAFGTLDLDNLVRTLGAPLDGRYPVSVLLPLAFVVVLGVAVARAAGRGPGELKLLALLAVAAPAGLLAVSLLGDDALLSRYSAVGAPLAIALVGALTTTGRAAEAACATLVALAVGASVASHGTGGRYPDVGGAIERISAQARPGDAVVIAPTGLGEIGSEPLLGYYRERFLPATPVAVGGSPEATAAIERSPRVWLLREPVLGTRELRAGLATLRLEVASTHVLEARADLQLVLAER